MIVDASVAVKWLIEEADSVAANALLRAPGLVAPDLVLSEVGNAIWKKRKRGDLAAFDVRVDGLGRIYARLAPAFAFVDRALALAERMDHPIYDCVYLAMAEAEDDIVVTADGRFIDACRRAGLDARLRVLGDMA